eukprot:6767727-Pyramimonas_sp.AAC.1
MPINAHAVEVAHLRPRRPSLGLDLARRVLGKAVALSVADRALLGHRLDAVLLLELGPDAGLQGDERRLAV